MSGGATTSLGYQPSLDGIRAAAVLMVVFAHTSGTINGGWVGVELFFVLSGFLITTLLIEEHRRSGEIRLGRFYERRARRLLPALVACIVVAGLLVALDERSREAAASYGVAAFGGLLFANNWLIATETANGSSLSHTWSLAQEEQFYLLWPVVLWLLLRRGTRLGTLIVLTAGVSIVAALWRAAAWSVFEGPSPRIDFGADTRALGLLLGCALALTLAHEGARQRAARLTAPLLVPALAVLVIAWAWLQTSLSQRSTIVGAITLVDVAAAVLIAHLVLNSTLAHKLFDSAPVVWIGQRSYGIYLFHFPIVALAIDDQQFAILGNDLAQGVYVLTASIAVAALSYRYVEQPFRGHGRRAVTAPTPAPRPLPVRVPADRARR